MKSGKIEDSQITASDHIGKIAGDGEELLLYLFILVQFSRETHQEGS